MNSKIKRSYTELENENKQMSEQIKELKDIIAQFKSQNPEFIQGNYNFLSKEDFSMRKTIIINKENEGDKIEEKIKLLKLLFEQTKKNWKKILSDLNDLKTEMEAIKIQMKNDFENFKKEYQKELKDTLENKYDSKMKLELKKINDCFDIKLEEKIRKMVERSQKQFEKLNCINKINEIEQKEKYSYKCLNSGELKVIINEGDDEAKLKITLINNGSVTWTEEKTVLGFDRKSKRTGEEIKLDPQKPGEKKSYDIFFKSLKSAKPGEYPFILKVFNGKEPFGGQLNGKLIIKKKEN